MADIAAGDRAAFQAVMNDYMNDVFRFSYSLLRDQARAEDTTQETFTRLWTHSASWQERAGGYTNTGVKSWLLRIAHNLCIDELRRRKSHINIDDMAATLADTTKGPRENLAGTERNDIVLNALLEIPERQRAALMLIHYHEHSNSEAAHVMNISVDALESLLARGRRTLKTILNDQKFNLLGD